DPVLSNCSPYTLKLRVHYIWIFALGPLIINSTSKTHCKLGVPFDKSVGPTRPDCRRVAYHTKSIGYFSNIIKSRLKPSRIQIDYTLEKHPLSNSVNFFEFAMVSRRARFPWRRRRRVVKGTS